MLNDLSTNFAIDAVRKMKELLLSPHFFLSFVAEDHRGGFAWSISVVLTVMIYLLGFLMAYVVFRRVNRMWSRRNNQKRSEILRDLIKKFVSGELESVQIKRSDRLFFRRILIEIFETNRSGETQKLQSLYRRLGFFEEDLHEMRSRFWPRRLAAVIRLETLRSQDASRRIFEHINDPNDFVAIAAMRAVSSLDFPERIDQILDSLARRAPARKDIFVEILGNIGRSHSQKILKYLSECYDPFIARICLSVLGELQEKQVVPLCRQLLKSSDDEVAAEAARTLGRLNAREAIEDLRSLLSSEYPQLRMEALIALIALGDQDFTLKLHSVQNDPSPIIQRALFERAGRSE